MVRSHGPRHRHGGSNPAIATAPKLRVTGSFGIRCGRDGRVTHRHQDKAAAERKVPPSPCGRGLGGGVGACSAPTFRALRPLPPTPSRKGRGRIFLGLSAILMPMGSNPAMTRRAASCCTSMSPLPDITPPPLFAGEVRSLVRQRAGERSIMRSSRRSWPASTRDGGQSGPTARHSSPMSALPVASFTRP